MNRWLLGTGLSRKQPILGMLRDAQDLANVSQLGQRPRACPPALRHTSLIGGPPEQREDQPPDCCQEQADDQERTKPGASLDCKRLIDRPLPYGEARRSLTTPDTTLAADEPCERQVSW